MFTGATSDTPTLRVGIAHADAPERAEQLVKMVRARAAAGADRAGDDARRGGGHPRRPGHGGLLLVRRRRLGAAPLTRSRLCRGGDTRTRRGSRAWSRPSRGRRPARRRSPSGWPARSTPSPAWGRRCPSGSGSSASARSPTCSNTRRSATSRPRPRCRSLISSARRRSRSTSWCVRSRKRRARRLTIVTARVRDDSGEIDAVWFNQEWLADKLTPGTRLRLRGQRRRNEFVVKSYDLGAAAATADFAPVYPASEEVPAKRLRTLVGHALPFVRDFPDLLPVALKHRLALPLRADALHALHQPLTEAEAEIGRRRLAFDELLELQVALALARRGREEVPAPALGEPGELIARYRDALPFAFTEHQERAITQIDHDLARRRADAAAAPGRRRLGQDRRRALRAAPRRRGRPPRRVDGADRDARRAALPDDRADLHRARRARRALTGSVRGRDRRADRRRHARADPGGRRPRASSRSPSWTSSTASASSSAGRSRPSAPRTSCT